jgi:AraC-like DNA-binding protein
MALRIDIHQPDQRSNNVTPSSGTVIFSSSLLQIGIFRYPTWSPFFHNSGPAGGYLLVFPRTSVEIIHEGRRPVVADPNVVMLYNQGPVYSRSTVSERGDLCDWFSFHPKTGVQEMRPFDSAVDERWDRPFQYTHGPSDPETYLLQRLAVQHIRVSERPDRLFVEETILAVLERVLGNTYNLNTKMPSKRPDTNKAHAALVYEAKAFIATRFEEPLTMDDIAQATHSSPFHLCRVFRQYTGKTIHHYRNQVRLKASLEYIAEPDISLTEIGLALGYASHSHFTKAFHKAFRATPSHLRANPSGSQIRELSKILTA